MKILAFLVFSSLMSGCVINGPLPKEDIAKDRIGRPISEEIEFSKESQGIGVDKKSYSMENGHQVIAIDECYVQCFPWSPYYDCIIFHEVNEKGIIVNAWPDPESWKVRPKEERGDFSSPRKCTP